MYLYADKSGLIKMRSEEPLAQYGTLKEIEVKDKDLDFDKLEKNYLILDKGGKIVYEEPPYIKDQAEKLKLDERRAALEEAKQKKASGELSLDDLYSLINKLA